MTAPAAKEDQRHDQFLNLCLLYGDFNRPIFLEAIRRWFVESATPAELKTLRQAIRHRAKSLRKRGTKGRPRAEENWDWIRRSAQLAWRRIILNWPWRRIATAARIEPTKANFRTLRNRLDRYAILVWRASQVPADNPAALKRSLEAKVIQRWYRSQVALPFDAHPEECKQIVLALAPRGLVAAAKLLGREINRRSPARKTGHLSLG